MMSVGVGGYMQQWFGYADRDDEGAEGGWDTQSDSEVHVKGSLESDMGLTFSAHIELEGNQNADGASEIDESFVRVSGEFGQLEMGARDHALVRMHYSIKDVGVGLNAGDTQKWVPGTYLETSGHAYSGGDDVKLNYISPRMNGIQVGLSYAPDQANENAVTTAPEGNDNASWGAAVNFTQPFGDGSVSLSLGHQNISSAASEIEFIPGAAPASGAPDVRLVAGQLEADEKAVAAYEAGRDLMTVEKAKTVVLTTEITQAALDARNRMLAATESAMKGDDSNFTNVGAGVTFGAFSFNVAYATMDSGAYTTSRQNMVLNANHLDTRGNAGYLALLNQNGGYVCDPTGGGATDACDDDADYSARGGANPIEQAASLTDGLTPAETYYFNKGTTAEPEYVAESATVNDPANDVVQETVVKDKSKSFDAWGASVTYTDGPMALSLAHMVHEADNGGERTATMFSASYNLAPGVDWRSSVFTVEDTTGHADVTGGMNEGTGFVTGITLSF